MKSILKLFFVFSASLFLIIVVVVKSDRAMADEMPAWGSGEPCCQLSGTHRYPGQQFPVSSR
jgi:hypothetical protein